MIHFDNVCKNFDGKQVLAGVSFDVVEGEILAIVGPSGTGKSVTLKHIVGLLTPDSGTVTVREGARIGYLFQGGALLAWLTVRENVSLPLRETTKLSEDEIARQTDEALKAAVFGVVIGTVSCHEGFETKLGAVGVGRATQRSVIISFLLILMFGYMITRLFYFDF